MGEKAYGRIQYLFMTKILWKLGIEDNLLKGVNWKKKIAYDVIPLTSF